MARMTSPLGVEVDVPEALAEQLKGNGYKPAGAKKPSKKADPEPAAEEEAVAEQPQDDGAPKPAPGMFAK